MFRGGRLQVAGVWRPRTGPPADRGPWTDRPGWSQAEGRARPGSGTSLTPLCPAAQKRQGTLSDSEGGTFQRNGVCGDTK